ncbi:g11510 [Coccomyxa elongata]
MEASSARLAHTGFVGGTPVDEHLTLTQVRYPLLLGSRLAFWGLRCKMVTKLLKRTSERYTVGSLYPGSLAKVKAPTSFFDPLTGSLMTEPVRLLNTNSVFDRRSLQAWYWKSKKEMEPKCPLTGEPLKGWINEQLSPRAGCNSCCTPAEYAHSMSEVVRRQLLL